LTRGASTVARHPLLGWAYVSDRGGELVSTVATLDPLDRGQSGRISAEKCRLEERSPVVVDADPGQGRTRGLAFSADGTMLYVATGSDASLHVYDTSIAPNGRPRQTLLGAIPLGFGPNVVRVAGLRRGEVRSGDALDPGAVGAAVDARGEGLVYVSTFDDDALLVVDPALMTVIARIPTGVGPHDIAFMPDVDGRLMAWVSNFRDHSLTLVDIDPDSPRRFTAVAQLR
jgi:YVTN family beta-propeller protein